VKKIILAALLCAFGLVLFPACNSRKESKNSSPKAAVQKMTVVKLGVVGENNEAWDLVKQKLVSQGIDLELVKFSD
jgi:D-methionine transport system substrate-binding protein